jgi:hypothetical protein
MFRELQIRKYIPSISALHRSRSDGYSFLISLNSRMLAVIVSTEDDAFALSCSIDLAGSMTFVTILSFAVEAALKGFRSIDHNCEKLIAP